MKVVMKHRERPADTMSKVMMTNEKTEMEMERREGHKETKTIKEIGLQIRKIANNKKIKEQGETRGESVKKEKS